MLILALGGVLVGFAFLVVSLVTDNSSWAWGCIGVCVAAVGVLAVDAHRRRQARATAAAVTSPGEGDVAELAAYPVAADPEPAQPAPVSSRPQPEPAPELVDDAAEPGVEVAGTAAALAVAGSERGVLVVDEHPRFHVDGCSWLAGRATMSLPAREAVELGFSPCSRCAPSRTLVALTPA